jgi:hypothetical protein
MAVIEYLGGRHATWWNYFSLQFLRYFIAVLALAIFVWSVYSEHRDRPSLQWPGASGTVEHSEEVAYQTTRHTGHRVDITYAYNVNGRRYAGHTIALWNEDWDNKDTGEFVAAHPVHSAVNVYYDPERPGNAVLIRGPDEFANRLGIWVGGIGFLGGIWMIRATREKAAETRAKIGK